MLEHLFGSKTRLKLLKIFFRKPNESFYVRELTRILDIQINAIRRELELLLKAGIIKETKDVKNDPDDKDKAGSTLRKYYTLDSESILYPELQALLVKAQVLGEKKFTDEIIEKGGEIKLFILTGQFTGNKSSLSDMLIVGKIKERAIATIVKNYETDFGFEIRYTLMTEEEFNDRRHVMDKFLFSIFDVGHIKVLSKINL